MTKHIKLWTSLALCVALTGCGAHAKEPEPPVSYDVGGDSAPSLNETLGEEGGKLASMEGPQEDEAASTSIPPTYTYIYTDLASGLTAVSDYISALTQSEQGFQVVDTDGLTVDDPAFSGEEGSTTLVKASNEEGKQLRLDISWTADGCTVSITQQDAPPVEKEVEPMTAKTAVDFLKALPPSLLGLEGDSMEEYNVYYLEGEALVNGIPCIRLRVYRMIPPEMSNKIAGTYFLTADKTQLFRLDMESNAVSEIALPK